MAGLNVTFNAYRKSVLEAGNSGNIPFLLTYKAGQEKIIIVFVVGAMEKITFEACGLLSTYSLFSLLTFTLANILSL